MSEQNSATLERASWLRRTLEVHLPQGVYQVGYSGRSLVHERIAVNGQIVVQHRLRNWFRPVSRFYVGSRRASIAIRVWPWLAIRSFHLLIDGQVLYCDRRPEFFEELEPRTNFSERVDTLEGPKDPRCPYCDRRMNGVGLDLAALPAELVRHDGLIGRPTAVFTFPRGQRIAFIMAGILAFIVGIGFLAALWFVLDHNLGFLGLLLAGIGPVLLVHALKYRRLHAVTGSEGVALIENDTVSMCRWQDVETVQETLLAGEAQSALKASARGENHVLRVRCRDGTELVFRSFLDDLPWLGQLIQHQTLRYLLPPAIAALNRGEVLYFGPLCIDREGLRSGPEKRLSWDEVQDVKIANGMLAVTQTGKRWAWFKVSLSQVPNAHVLLALAGHDQKRVDHDDRSAMAGV